MCTLQFLSIGKDLAAKVARLFSLFGVQSGKEKAPVLARSRSFFAKRVGGYSDTTSASCQAQILAHGLPGSHRQKPGRALKRVGSAWRHPATLVANGGAIS